MRPFLLCVTGIRKETVQLVHTAKINAKASQRLFCRMASIMLPTSHRGKTCQKLHLQNKSA
nr:MAG TPA: hypothetical protein [Caudoviricetes sp.]